MRRRTPEIPSRYEIDFLCKLALEMTGESSYCDWAPVKIQATSRKLRKFLNHYRKRRS